MSDLGEIFNGLKMIQQKKRADNRKKSAEYLTRLNIPFVSKNDGAHLIVDGGRSTIDFWPGTGKWICRRGKKGRGVCNLASYIGRSCAGRGTEGWT